LDGAQPPAQIIGPTGAAAWVGHAGTVAILISAFIIIAVLHRRNAITGAIALANQPVEHVIIQAGLLPLGIFLADQVSQRIIRIAPATHVRIIHTDLRSRRCPHCEQQLTTRSPCTSPT